MVLNKSISLVMAFHAHQPVDNFCHVFEQAFNKSYQPFLNAISDFPDIKISLHISGSLLDWILVHRPQFISKLKGLVENGQVEILTAGYYEPILMLLPDRDKLAQIEMHKSRMKLLFGITPEGLWLTERVWEPSLPKPLKQAGIKFTVVDDEHFRIAGKDPESLSGYYISEEELYEIAIFPGSKFLRYSLPFKLVPETLNYLKKKLEQNLTCITFADDLEKFGFWPHTYEWVYEKGWLNEFFQALKENSSWIETLHFRDALRKFEPSDRIYLPCASYSEMMEWSENMFRNFLVKYPEANQLHKRMFQLSNNINEIQTRFDKEKIEQAKIHLYKAQDNDVYWHGVFGGLYLTHLRNAAYQHLIKAEKILEQLYELRFPVYEIKDYDLDGRKELIFKDQIYNIYIAPEMGGAITEIDYKPGDINLVNTLTRRYERYHKKIIDKKTSTSSHSSKEGPASIHELQLTKQENLIEFLIYDRYRKVSWLDHIYSSNIEANQLLRCETNEVDYFWNKKYRYEINRNLIKLYYTSLKVDLTKELEVEKDLLKFRYKILSKTKEAKFFSPEFNFLFYDAQILAEVGFREIKELKISDSWFNLIYEISLEPKALLFSFPIETISDSEAGTERTYQGCCLHFIWPFDKAKIEPEFKLRVCKK